MFYIGGIFWSICAVLVSKIFCISPKESFPGISSMYFWVSFLIIQIGPITNGIVFFKFPYFFHFYFEVFVFGKLVKFFQSNIFISRYSDNQHGSCSFFEVFGYYVWLICIYFSIPVNSKVS